MAIDFDDFFGKAGKAFYAGSTANTALATTVYDEAEDFAQQFGTSPLAIQSTVSGVASAVNALKNAGRTFNQNLVATPIRNLLVEVVKADNPQPSSSVSTALAEFISQMLAESETLDASTPGASVGYDGDNVGDGLVVVSTQRGDGLTNEHILAENIHGQVSSIGSNGQATLRLQGEPRVDSLHPDWPGGSGLSATLTSYVGSSAANLVTGTFETDDPTLSDLPEGWIASVGEVGTTIKITPVEVQTITLSGDPGSGWYILSHTDKNGDVQTTAPLPYNATSAQVQAALRSLTGLAAVEVAGSGTAPNLVHTVTFIGVPNPGELTSHEEFDQGSIAHATTTAGSANVIRGARSLELDSDGNELTTLNYKVLLSAATGYRFNAYMLADVVPAAGEVTIDLVDGIGGTVLQDDQGVNNSFTVDCTALTTSFSAQSASFRTPSNLPPSVYLRIRISTAVSDGTSLFLDEVCLVPETELYAGGLFATCFTGPTPWRVGDRVTITATNDRAGALHEWMERVFGLRASRLLLPTDSGGSETIDDSLIG